MFYIRSMIRLQHEHDGHEIVIRVTTDSGRDTSVYIVPELFDGESWQIAKDYQKDFPEVLHFLKKREQIELNKTF